MRRTNRGVVAAMLFVLAAGSTPSTAQTVPTPAPSPRPQLFLALYERGSAWNDAKGVFEQTWINEHMQFLRANAVRLVGAGRFEEAAAAGGADRTVGMVIFTAASQEEAQALIAGDPAISGKTMKASVRRWLTERVKAY